MQPMPIIVGAPRSGTTMLRFMLDAHSQLAIPPETWFLPPAGDLMRKAGSDRDRFFEFIIRFPASAPAWNDFHVPAAAFRARLARLEPFTVPDGLRLFYRMYAERFQKPRWGDKTPAYALHMSVIAGILPEARFIHIIRDGRDVAVSLRQRWFSPGHAIKVQAKHWRDHVEAARQQGRAGLPYLELRYEDLVRDPLPHLKRVCAFIELDFEPGMVSFHTRAAERLREHLARYGADGRLLVSREERLKQQARTQEPLDASRIGAWRRELTPGEQRGFEAVAGETLKACGYPTAG